MKNKFGKIYVDYLYDHVLEDVKKDIDVNIKEMPVIKEKVENEIFVKCFKSLIYCMNLERVEKKLVGENPEERYTFFCENKDAIILYSDSCVLLILHLNDNIVLIVY